jgi:peptidoglycan L-alanyl-D-glutamate endopeptidase CwlK
VVRARAAALLQLCAQAGLSVMVSQGLRSWAEQDALYAKGRTAPPIGRQHVVTKAKGGQSYHNFGLAFDIMILDALGKADWNPSHPGWNAAGALGKSVGLEWGGDWTGFKDRPHFQYTGGLSLAVCRSLFPQGLELLWQRVT